MVELCYALPISICPSPIRLTPMQKLVWEQEAKRHVPLLPVVLHQGYNSKAAHNHSLVTFTALHAFQNPWPQLRKLTSLLQKKQCREIEFLCSVYVYEEENEKSYGNNVTYGI